MAHPKSGMDLSKWSLFSLLDPDFLSTVRLACVFGQGNEGLMVTRSDEVYAVGSNKEGCLGVGDMASTLLPRKVEALCKKVTIILYSMALCPGCPACLVFKCAVAKKICTKL